MAMSLAAPPSPASQAINSARCLQRCGQWGLALAALAGADDDGRAAALRAEILVDRHAWRLDPPQEALEAARSLEPADPPLAAYLIAQLAYWQRVFNLGGDPVRPDVIAAFDEVVDEPGLGSWPRFFRSVAIQYLREDFEAAAEGFDQVLASARETDDLLLESYALRHQAEMMPPSQAPNAVELVRRSLNLRVAVGARPHCAASQAMLARTLPAGPEAAELRRLSAHTAVELGLTWLLPEPA